MNEWMDMSTGEPAAGDEEGGHPDAEAQAQEQQRRTWKVHQSE